MDHLLEKFEEDSIEKVTPEELALSIISRGIDSKWKIDLFKQPVERRLTDLLEINKIDNEPFPEVSLDENVNTIINRENLDVYIWSVRTLLQSLEVSSRTISELTEEQREMLKGLLLGSIFIRKKYVGGSTVLQEEVRALEVLRAMLNS